LFLFSAIIYFLEDAPSTFWKTRNKHGPDCFAVQPLISVEVTSSPWHMIYLRKTRTSSSFLEYQ
jgi:hypothetical protein